MQPLALESLGGRVEADPLAPLLDRPVRVERIPELEPLADLDLDCNSLQNALGGAAADDDAGLRLQAVVT